MRFTRGVAAAVLAAVIVTGGAWGCERGRAVITPAPAPTQVNAARETAKRIADETRRAVEVARVLRTTAQNLTEPNGPIKAADMDKVDRAAIKYGTALKVALEVLGNVGTDPQLKSTARAIWLASKEFIDQIPVSGQLAALVETLKIVLTVTLENGGGAEAEVGGAK
jgi:hypothetical protein